MSSILHAEKTIPKLSEEFFIQSIQPEMLTSSVLAKHLSGLCDENQPGLFATVSGEYWCSEG